MSDRTSSMTMLFRGVAALSDDVSEGVLALPRGQERRCILRFAPAGDELAERRFMNAATIAMKVSHGHPNLVTMWHVGTWHDGRLVAAMDHIPGRTVAELRAQLVGHFPVIVRIADTVLDVLAYLHERGVAHREMVPEKLLVDSRGRVWVGSFDRAVRAGSATEDGWSAWAEDDLAQLGSLLFELTANLPLPRWCEPDDISSELPPDAPTHLRALIAALLAPRDIRPSAADALAQLRREAAGSASSADLARLPVRASMARALDRSEAVRATTPASLLEPAASDVSEVDDESGEDELDRFASNMSMMFAALVQRSVDEQLRPLRKLPLAAGAMAGALAVLLILVMYQLWQTPAQLIASAPVPTQGDVTTAPHRATTATADVSTPSPREPVSLGSAVQRLAAADDAQEPLDETRASDPASDDASNVPSASPAVLDVSPPSVPPPRRTAESTAVERLYGRHTASNGQGVTLGVEPSLRLKGGLFLDIDIRNNRREPYRMSRVELVRDDQTRSRIVEVRFSGTEVEPCAESGVVAVEDRCRISLWLPDASRRSGESFILRASGAGDARSVSVRGLMWPKNSL